MERNILFRGKRIDNGEWLEGYYAVIGKRNVIIAQPDMYYTDNAEEVYANEIHDIDPETVCRYTGLTDKNGRKIFEGDILKYAWNGKEEVDVVEYRAPMFSYRKVIRWSLYEDEVIGNIFDNPTLLESELGACRT